jgi:hypothetical protein
MALPQRVRLSEIVAKLDIHPTQTAAIVAQVAARIDRWLVARRPSRLIVPTVDDLAIERGGRLWWRRGQCVAPEQGARALGGLLAALLARAPQGSAPPGLLYVVSRSTDLRHLAPLTRMDEFATAVLRHAPDAPFQAVDALMATFVASTAGMARLDEHASIADVRRWRRAGGVSLQTIAADTGIPASLLRELEWGVYANWAVPHADGSISAYAERAGLDAAAVIRIVGREQSEVSGLPVPLAGTPPALDQRYRVLPYACAATLVMLLGLLAPGDGAERIAVAAPQEFTVLEPHFVPAMIPLDAVPTAAPSIDDPGDSSPAGGTSSRSVRPAQSATPTPSRPSASRSTARPESTATNPLARVTRAIVGDGKHQVEPFPRPAPTRQPKKD